MTTIRAAVLGAAVTFATFAEPAVAALDQQADLAWTRAVGVEAIGTKCGWLSGPKLARVKATESALYAGIVRSATADENNEVKALDAPAERAWIADKVAKTPCSADAQRAFNRQVGEFLESP